MPEYTYTKYTYTIRIYIFIISLKIHIFKFINLEVQLTRTSFCLQCGGNISAICIDIKRNYMQCLKVMGKKGRSSCRLLHMARLEVERKKRPACGGFVIAALAGERRLHGGQVECLP